MTTPVPLGPASAAVGILTTVLGRPPTKQEMVDLSPLAVMVQAFYASAGPGDRLDINVKQWDKSYLFGAYETHGQEIKVKPRKAREERP